jgi:NMT1-like family
MDLVAQVLLGGTTALFLGIMIFLIYAMDRPSSASSSPTWHSLPTPAKAPGQTSLSPSCARCSGCIPSWSPLSRGGAGIREIADLAGKRINVGKEGSGTRATWEIIEAALGWDEAHRARVTQLPADATTHALCMGEIDANLLIVGHPSEQVRNQLLACDANLVAITGPIVDKLLNTSPYYYHVSIPGDSYGLPANLPSFGVARC